MTARPSHTPKKQAIKIEENEEGERQERDKIKKEKKIKK